MTLPSYAEPQSSPVRNGYFARNRLANLALRTIDFALALFITKRLPGEAPPVNPRILLANGAHLGDVVLSLSAVQALKAALPNASVSMLVGSWSAEIARASGLVERVHVLDHWRLNRAGVSKAAKIRQYLKTRSSALREVRAANYDLAIDLYFYVPNAAVFLWQAKIPRRVGFRSAGFGPMYTQAVDWLPGRGSIASYHLQLLANALPEALGASMGSVRPRTSALFGQRPSVKLAPKPYVVIHMGTGGFIKEWPLDRWLELTSSLDCQGINLVLTGAGREEGKRAKSVNATLRNGVDLSNRISVSELVEVIRDAHALIGLDSVAVHIAASVGTPSVVLSNGVNDHRLWKPLSDTSIVVRHPVGCTPCFRKRGCDAMACIRLIEPSEVLNALEHVGGTAQTPRNAFERRCSNLQ